MKVCDKCPKNKKVYFFIEYILKRKVLLEYSIATNNKINKSFSFLGGISRPFCRPARYMILLFNGPERANLINF